MVVLEAAAITAGGVAAYKGGKAATMATAKSIKTKLKLGSQEKERKETFSSRKTERKERFSKVNEYRNSLKNVNNSREGGIPVPSFNWKTDKTKNSNSASSFSSTNREANSSTYSKSGSSRSNSSNWWDKK